VSDNLWKSKMLWKSNKFTSFLVVKFEEKISNKKLKYRFFETYWRIEVFGISTFHEMKKILLWGCTQRTSLQRGGVIKKFVVCVWEDKTNEGRRLGGGERVRNLYTNAKMLQDVLCERFLMPPINSENCFALIFSYNVVLFCNEIC
jgi:hypothetical protein